MRQNMEKNMEKNMQKNMEKNMEGILFHLERKYRENLESEYMTVQNIVSANTRTVRI